MQGAAGEEGIMKCEAAGKMPACSTEKTVSGIEAQTGNLPYAAVKKMDVREARAIVSGIEARMRELPDAMIGDCFPLTHTFANGLYVRQITVPAGVLLVSKIHKFSHAAFLLKGEISIFGTEGVSRLKAPASIITPAGTKRVVYHHEDTVFTTVHATDKTDVAEIEDEIIAKDFDELDGTDEYIDVECIAHVIRQMEGSL
jgi:hypothetical protein